MAMHSTSTPFHAEPSAAGRTGREIEKWSAMEPGTLSIRGLPFSTVPARAAIERIFGQANPPRPWVSIAADYALLAAAESDEALRRVLFGADVVLPMGRAPRWLGRLLGSSIGPDVSLGDWCTALVEAAAAQRLRVFFLGLHGVEVGRLERRFPGLQVAGYDSGLVQPWVEVPTLKPRIRSSGAQLIIARSCNATELEWLTTRGRALGTPICACGYSATTRSATAMATSGGKPNATWARLGMHSRNFRRHLQLLVRLAGDVATLRARHFLPHVGPTISSATIDWIDLDAGNDLTDTGLIVHGDIWDLLVRSNNNWALHAAKVRRVDAIGLGFLLRCRQTLGRAGCNLVIVDPSPRLRAAIGTARLETVLPCVPTAAAARQWATAQYATPSTREANARSLAWCGEIVGANADDVWQMTLEYLQSFVANGAALVVIDLGRLRGIDAAGAALMIRVKHWARRLRTEVLFTHVQPTVRHFLSLAQVDALLLEGGQ